jgi:23S rRNA (guanosine2251-2'-O)-methyltransferase
MKKEDFAFSQSNLLEGMTSISALLNTPSTINDRRVIKIQIDESKRRSKAAEIGFLIAKSKELGFDLEFVSGDEIDAITVGSSHGGIVALCSDRTYPILSKDLIDPNGFYVYLEGIEDPYNFGNAIRSLYAAGVSGIVIPPRNWMSASAVVAKSSAGTSERLPIYICDADSVATIFHDAGYRVLCAGIRDSVSVFEAEVTYPALLVIGGEKRGISRNILAEADQILRIDYGREFRGSLSAASAATIMVYEIFRQNRTK